MSAEPPFAGQSPTALANVSNMPDLRCADTDLLQLHPLVLMTVSDRIYEESREKMLLVTEHYSQILDRSRTSLEELKNDTEKLYSFTAAHNAASDLDQLEVLLRGRTELEMFQLAKIEYQHALYSASFAQYRQSHISLRLFFELSLCSVLFSAHEIDMHLWLKDEKDSNWTAIISNETGVLSKQFVGAFFPELKEHCDQYRAMAATLYRECSQFVHGNRHSFNGIDGKIKYNAEILESWIDRADTAFRVVKFTFACRYLRGANHEQRSELEQMLLEEFGDLAAIQAQFEGKQE